MNTSIREKSGLLKNLLDEIEDCRAGSDFTVAAETVFTLTGSSHTTYVRFLYSHSDASWSEAYDTSFSRTNTEALIRFLEHIDFPDAERRFRRRGLFLNEEDHLNWFELFQSVTLARLASHTIDRDLLETAIAGCRHFVDAADFYCFSRFDQDEYIRFAMDRYFERYKIRRHELSEDLLDAYIRNELNYKILGWKSMYRSIFDRLHEQAVLWGLVDPDNEPIRRQILSRELQDALIELELPTDHLPTRGALKEQYHSMLKLHHPDINPSGQERTRRIVDAYNVLLVHYLP